MKLNGKHKMIFLLIIVAMVGWLLRRMNVVDIPALTSLCLAVGMGMLGIDYIQQRKKAVGIMILAFGLLMLITGFLEINELLNALP